MSTIEVLESTPASAEYKQLELKTFLDIPALRQLMNDFSKLTGISLAICDLKGELLIAVGWQEICIKFHQAEPKSAELCRESVACFDQHVFPGSYREYRCKNNLRMLATPIMLGGKQVGNFVLTQLLYAHEETDKAVFRNQAELFGYDETAYLRALDGVPRLSRDTVHNAMAFCSKLSQQISETNYAKAILAETLAAQKKAEEELRKSEASYRLLAEYTNDMLSRHAMDGTYTYLSPSCQNLLGYTPQELLGVNPYLMVHPDDISRVQKAHFKVVKNQTTDLSVYRFKRKDGQYIWVETNNKTVADPFTGELLEFVCISRDITVRKQVEVYREISREVLRILNEPEDAGESIRQVLECLHTRTGLDAVGMRLQTGDDYPYIAQKGFSQDFIQKENSLTGSCSVKGICREEDGKVKLECTCGLVISGKTDPTQPFFTAGGSCWTNDAIKFIGLSPEDDPRYIPRNHCIHQGYASLALVPIRNQKEIVGLLQLNDRRKGCLTLEIIEILEAIAAHIGSALMRKQSELAMRESESALTRLLDTIPVPIYFKNRAGQIKWCNRAIENFFGKSKQELMSLSIYDVFSKSIAEIYDADEQKLLAQRGNIRREVQARDKAGKLHYLISEKASFVDLQGSITGLINVFLDITERKRLEKEVLEISEREQQRIGRDLHDGLGQELTGIALLGKVMAQQLQMQGSALYQDAMHLTDLVSQAIGKLNIIVRGVFPTQFALAGLDVSLSKMAESIRECHHLECVYQPSEENLISDEATALQLFYIAKEATNNAIKHAGATLISIRLEKRAQDMLLSIQDNGERISRFTPNQTGMGLQIMRYRAQLIGAEFEIRSTSPAGTLVTCCLPLSA
ncbi:MAG: PAS domain S-box protein [Desulfobulbaceae bacterium]|nr:PAS domain S-box protein [Desulfobulbaceae bacterium]